MLHLKCAIIEQRMPSWHCGTSKWHFERLFYLAILLPIVPDGRKQSDVKVGGKVMVVEKRNQPSGKLTEGVVRRILTSSPNHPHGIKVELDSGIVGRVKEILSGEFSQPQPGS